MFKFHECEFKCYINSLLMFTFLRCVILEQDLSLITLLCFTFSFVSHYMEYNDTFELFPFDIFFFLVAVLVSRQFVDMTRIRIEGLLAAFPKLVGTGKQHTYVETENVRYVYQPIEALYLLLVTNKQSNILEDLETLRLLSKLVSFSWWSIVPIHGPKLSLP